MALFALSIRQTRTLIAAVAVSLTFALVARYVMIENGPLGRECEVAVSVLLCSFRLGVVQAFNNQVFGALALIFAALSIVRPSFGSLMLAMSAAAIGLVLYNTTGAALAIALSLFVFARPAAKA